MLFQFAFSYASCVDLPDPELLLTLWHWLTEKSKLWMRSSTSASYCKDLFVGDDNKVNNWCFRCHNLVLLSEHKVCQYLRVEPGAATAHKVGNRLVEQLGHIHIESAQLDSR